MLVFSDKKAYNFLVWEIIPGPDGAAAHPARIIYAGGEPGGRVRMASGGSILRFIGYC